MSEGTRHLYVHAPFCARRCVYCDFAVSVDADPTAVYYDLAPDRLNGALDLEVVPGDKVMAEFGDGQQYPARMTELPFM